MEKAALRDILAVKGRVVAAGGGAFLDEGNRALMKAYGPVVYLEANAETVLRRLESGREPAAAPGAPTGKASYATFSTGGSRNIGGPTTQSPPTG